MSNRLHLREFKREEYRKRLYILKEPCGLSTSGLPSRCIDCYDVTAALVHAGVQHRGVSTALSSTISPGSCACPHSHFYKSHDASLQPFLRRLLVISFLNGQLRSAIRREVATGCGL